MSTLLVRPLSGRVDVFLPDHCQVGFAVILIIGAILFCRMKKPKTLSGLGLGLGSTIKIIYTRDLPQLRNCPREKYVLEFLSNCQGRLAATGRLVRAQVLILALTGA